MSVNLVTDNNLSATEQYVKDATGNTSALAIGTDGKVGIGTTDPSAPLQANTPGTATAIKVTQTNASGRYLELQTYNICVTGDEMDIGTVDNQPLYFYTNGGANKRMTIAGGGNVGIGTTSPVEKIDVNGGIKIGTTENTNAGTLRWKDGNLQVYNGSGWVTLSEGCFWSQNGSKIYYDAGNVGIGTNDPAAKCEIHSGFLFLSNPGNDAKIQFRTGTPTLGNRFSMGVDYSDSNKFKISQYDELGSNDILVINEDQQIGLGMSPASGARLDVNGPIRIASGYGLKVGSDQVVGARQTGTAVNAYDIATAITLVNDLKAKLIAHGLIS